VDDKPGGIELLTERQKQVLRMIARHMQEKEIARELKISVPTVKDHAAMARRHLRVDTTRKAALILADFETATATIPDVGYTARTVATAAEDGQAFGHEPNLSSRRRPPDHQLSGTGNGLAHDGGTGQTEAYRRHHSGGASDQSGTWPAEGGLQHGLRDSLADGGRMRRGYGDRFRQWLKDLPVIAWLGLVVGVAVMTVVLAAAFISLILGSLEAVHQASHYFGWRN